MSRSRQLSTTLRFTVLVVVLSLLAGPSALLIDGRSASAAPLHAVPGLSVTVPAGGTAAINVRSIALTPGAALPVGPLTLAVEPLAADRLRTAVYYGIDWGYADSAPGQVALALWQLQDGVWRAEDRAVAERIAGAAATSQGTPSWLTEGSSILQAAAQGQVTLSELVLTPLADDPSIGAASLTVINTSPAGLVLYLPYGTVFSGPNGSVIAWAAVGFPDPQPTPTTQPAEPSPTATTVEPPATPTTVQPPQPAPPTKGEPATATATSVLEPTVTPRPKGDTPTPPPPTETATTEPPTSTPTPADTPAVLPTVTPAQQSGTGRQSPERQPAPEVPPVDPVRATNTGNELLASSPLPPGSATQAPNTGQSAPIPVGTSAAAGAPAPLPVATQPGAVLPNPVATAGGTTPPGGQVPPPVPSVPASRQASPTAAHSPSPSPSPTVFQKPDENATVSPVQETPVQPPTPLPTPVPIPPTPAPVPPTVAAPPAEGPIINVAPGNSDEKGAGAPSPGESSGSGVPETYNPTTGGGPSALPVWLGILSAVMVLGGWGLKRVSRTAPVRVRRQDQVE